MPASKPDRPPLPWSRRESRGPLSSVGRGTPPMPPTQGKRGDEGEGARRPGAVPALRAPRSRGGGRARESQAAGDCVEPDPSTGAVPKSAHADGENLHRQHSARMAGTAKRDGGRGAGSERFEACPPCLAWRWPGSPQLLYFKNPKQTKQSNTTDTCGYLWVCLVLTWSRTSKSG